MRVYLVRGEELLHGDELAGEAAVVSGGRRSGGAAAPVAKRDARAAPPQPPHSPRSLSAAVAALAQGPVQALLDHDRRHVEQRVDARAAQHEEHEVAYSVEW